MPYELLSPSVSCKSSDSSSSCRIQDQYFDNQNPNLTKTTIEGSTRKRVYRACEVCRRKKVKCNGQKPCSHCIAFAEECYYVDTKDRSAYSRRYVESLEQRLAKMEKSLSIACGEAKLCGCKANHSDSTSSTGECLDFSEDHRPVDAIMPAPSGNIAYPARAPILSLVTEANQILAPTRLETQDAVHFACSLDWNSFEDGESRCGRIPLDEARAYLPQQYILNKLVEAFYERVYPVFPIVAESELNGAVERIMCSTPRIDSIDATDLALVLSVLACGARVMRDDREVDSPQQSLPSQLAGLPHGPPTSSQEAEFSYIQSKRGAIYAEQSQLLAGQSMSENTIGSIQVHALQAFYSSSVGSITKAWVTIGNAMRLAIHLGIHQQMQHAAIPDSERQIRSRVWWSTYVLDRMLGSSLGRPFGIDDREVDTGTPRDTDLALKGLAPGFDALVSLTRISGQVAITANVLEREGSQLRESEIQRQTSRARALEHALDAWSQSLPAGFMVQTLNYDHPLNLQSCVTSCLLQSTRLQLYNALQPRSKTFTALDQNLHVLLDKCTQTAQQIIRAAARVVLILPPSFWLYNFANSLVISGGFLALNAVKHQDCSQFLIEAEGAVNGLHIVEQILPDVLDRRRLLSRMLRKAHEQLLLFPSGPQGNRRDIQHSSESSNSIGNDVRLQKRPRAATMCSSAPISSDTQSRTRFCLESLGSGGDDYTCDQGHHSPAYSESAMHRVALPDTEEQRDGLGAACTRSTTGPDFEPTCYTRTIQEVLAQDPSLLTAVPYGDLSTATRPRALVGPPTDFADSADRFCDAGALATFDAQSELSNFSSLLSDFIVNTPLQSVSR